jgi:REP element-mobilizing transposase RayT
MKTARQFNLNEFFFAGAKVVGKKNTNHQRMKSFGGSLLKCGHARTARPLSSKDFTHIVLKSDLAKKTEKSDLRMIKKRHQVENIIKTDIHNFGIRVHKLAVASNHIHILISFKNRRKYFAWIRRITGLIARLMLQKERGLALEKHQIQKKSKNKLSFWSQRPFTRIVSWGRDYKTVFNYIEKNILQALGFGSYVPRGLQSQNRIPSTA